jgi:hypothetical protein
MADRKRVRPVQQMLDDPNKGINKTYGSWGLLSKLWRIFLKENHVSGYRFWMLMDRFLNDPKNRSKKNNKEHADNRGNLNKEFSNPAMSWKVFCKALRFAQIIEFRITLEARHRDGHITVHRTMANLDDDLLLNDPRFKEELEQVLEERADNPQAANLPVPEDQEPIVFLDPHPDDIQAGIVHTDLGTDTDDDDEDEDDEDEPPEADGANDDPIYQ